ncbi:MAG: MBL fold metallo-hydrolase [Bacteroidaceae bacterium]|nr:MBL fold metallo-hydrolase [Bacteroidaceae bacterium]
MHNEKNFITMLGTGNALATRCYNTFFTLHSKENVLLVDAGGGNGILTQLERAGICREDISDLFVTHAHTDHLLGCIWMMRMALQFNYALRVWSHKKVLQLLTDICSQILPRKEAEGIGSLVTMNCLSDGEQFEAGGFTMQCFDIHSIKERQFGFTALLPDGQRLCCLGDEPFSSRCKQYAEGADWLMSEAFCLHEDREQFQPYEKHHSTVLDAARLAEELGVKNLILYHTEDRTLDTRRQRYTAEAKTAFSGRVLVPDDLERITL